LHILDLKAKKRLNDKNTQTQQNAKTNKQPNNQQTKLNNKVSHAHST
jgi:hypothetical protein